MSPSPQLSLISLQPATLTVAVDKPFKVLHYRVIQWRMDLLRVGGFEGLFISIVLLLMSLRSNCRIKIYGLVCI